MLGRITPNLYKMEQDLFITYGIINYNLHLLESFIYNYLNFKPLL